MKTVKSIAEEFIKPFRHQLRLGEEEGFVIDLVRFGDHLLALKDEYDKVNPYDLLQECVDTFTCQDSLDADLKDRIIRILKKRENENT